MTEAVYQKGGKILFAAPRMPLLFSLSLPGVAEGCLSYGNRRSRVVRSKALVCFTDVKDGDYPILLTDGTHTFCIASVRKAGDELLDLTVNPERIADLCERLSKAEEEIVQLKAASARLTEKIGADEIFTL